MLTALLAALALVLTPHQDAQSKSGPFRELALEQALEEAGREGKIVLVEFCVSWSQPCKQLDQLTWSNAVVQKWLNEHTVPIKVNGEREPGLAARYDVSDYPTLVFLRPDGAAFARVGGFQSGEDFLRDAYRILDSRRNIDEAKQDLDANPDDPSRHLTYARALLKNGRVKEAVDEMLWAFDHGAQDPAFALRRESELLPELAGLARRDPRVRPALLERRNRAHKLLLDGGEKDQLEAAARELVPLELATSSTPHLLGTWEKLREKEGTPPSVLKILFHEEVALLLQQKGRFLDMLAGVGDPLAHMDSVFAGLVRLREEEAPAVELRSNRAVSEGARYYMALLATDQQEAALELADLMIAFEPRGQTYVALVTSAIQVGARENARAIGKRGLESAPPGRERDRLVALMARLFPDDK